MKYLREYLVPVAVLSMVAGMLLPLPAELLDYLLIINILLAFGLLGSALYASDPLKLSSLPSILLLATLFRLALNISSTRLILGEGKGGEVIEAFGSMVVGDSVAIGVVVFLMITLVQFVVIAKGAERVAEVAARFTLDALPGKQMSIDADLRAGVIDSERASIKREELQTESRFYGALDGAMKFVKGDAIAGIVIVVINVIGGFITGLAVENLSLLECLSKFTSLSIGDGLVSQIPALLNSLAAGIVVTRVTKGEGSSVAGDFATQLGGEKAVRIILACISFIAAFVPALPTLPLLIAGALLLFSTFGNAKVGETEKMVEESVFQPRSVPLVEVVLCRKISNANNFIDKIEGLRRDVFELFGLILPKIVITLSESENSFFKIRGSVIRKLAEADSRDIISEIKETLEAHLDQLIDDILTRKMLDFLDQEAPELVSNTIPNVISVTQLTIILKNLIKKKISIRQLDTILQAVAESGVRGISDRLMLEEVRVALGNEVCRKFIDDKFILRAVVLDPLMDITLSRANLQGEILESDLVRGIVIAISEDERPELPILVSKAARRLVDEILITHDLNRSVIAFEEVPKNIQILTEDIIRIKDTETSESVIERLAA